MDAGALDRLAARLASEDHPAEAWMLQFARLPRLVERGCLSASDALRLAEVTPAPSLLAVLIGDWEEEHEDDGAAGSPWDRLADAVDESVFPIEAWMRAYAVLTSRLAEQGRKARFERKLGYLVCSAEFASRNPVRPALPDVVDDMLAEFGFAPDS